jgi:hypothetical protein
MEELSVIVVDVAFHIHKGLGPGLLESVYEAALAKASNALSITMPHSRLRVFA